MKTVVYVDVLFAVNFIINCLLLLLTAKIGRLPLKRWRIILSALLGAVYAVLMFFPNMSFIYSVGAKLLFSCLTVAVAYNIHGIRLYLKALGIFYLATFCFGGGVFALCSFTGIGAATGALVSNGIFYINLPWQVLFVAVGISYIILRIVWASLKNRLSGSNMYVGISIFLDGKRVDVNALIDTGNSLYDPLSSAPVIVAEYEKIKTLLPEKVCHVLESTEEYTPELWCSAAEDTSLKPRLIPFSSLGRERGMLPGFKPDKVAFYQNEQTTERANITVGIYSKPLTKDHSYSALLHPELISG